MQQIDPKKLSPSARQAFKLIEFDENEKLLLEIRKHPFGLFLIYLIGGFVTVAMLSLSFGIALARGDVLGIGVDAATLQLPIIFISFLLAILSLVMTAIGSYLYKSNVVLVTSEKISQLINLTIFNRKISQLSIGDVQDVTVVQKGLFAHWFKYGTIVIETAGEQSNYNFTFAPDPYEAAKVIVGAHEMNLKEFGN
jgi:hypothetical protein